MHNFWGFEDAAQRAHEMQNFIKNLAIMAGLLVITGLDTGKFSLATSEANQTKPSLSLDSLHTTGKG